eukprot:286264-Rhodomonas_salina.1
MLPEQVEVVVNLHVFLLGTDTHDRCRGRLLVVRQDELEMTLRQFDGAVHDCTREQSFDAAQA